MERRTDKMKASNFWREGSVDSFDDSSNLDSSVEISPFRGFLQMPRVVISKINIEPYLNNAKGLVSSGYNVGGKTPSHGKQKILPQLVANCSVKLPRDDLELLKEEVIKNSRLKAASKLENLSMPLVHCKICEKAYSSEKKLQKHLGNKHMLVYDTGYIKPQKRVSFSDNVIVHEIRDYHKCRKCTRIFENYKFLKTHMKQMHKKRKSYICNYCSKKFVDRMFFKVHIKLHCDMCSLLFPNKKLYSMHRHNSCRVLKKYNCKTCHDIFFSYMDLKDHSYDHLENLFICDICKEQFDNKCAVAHHISFLHSKKRPNELYTFRSLGNERLYLCNFCETSSIDRDMIESHVSVLPDLNCRKRTGYKDYYFCDQCLKKFDTETRMLQHKWTHFLNTCDNSQVQQKSILVKPLNEGKTRQIDVEEKGFVRKFNINGELPKLMQPIIICERLNFDAILKSVESVVDTNSNNVVDNQIVCISDSEGEKEANRHKKMTVRTEDADKIVCLEVGPKKTMAGPKSKKILISPDDVLKNAIVHPKPKKILISPDDVLKKATIHRKSKKNLIGPDDVLQPKLKNILINSDDLLKKAIVDPKSKKTLLSRFQCHICNKYFSNNYCLNRHIATRHGDLSNLRCNNCEETFVWPDLLSSHNCIRMNIPEQAFDDVRPEIQLQNYRDFGTNGFDELMNIADSDDYMNSVDFDIPAPIVQLTEYENCVVNTDGRNGYVQQNSSFNLANGYKIVVQEVPIEF